MRELELISELEAVFGASDAGQVVRLHGRQGGGELALAAVDHDEVRARGERVVVILAGAAINTAIGTPFRYARLQLFAIKYLLDLKFDAQ